jgi:curli biogenesis system outer membrane secretion channel CsgG
MKQLLKSSLPWVGVLALAISAPAQGRKEVLAIGKVEATKALAEDMQRKGRNLEMRRVVEALDGHLISALAQTRKFTLVGRSDLADLLKEQDLGDSGIVDAGTAAEKGKVKGAKYRLVTTVDSFLEENTEAVFPATGRKGTKRRFQLSAQAKVYDASTGELLDAPNVQLEKVDTIITDGSQTTDARRTDELMPALAREMAEKVAYRVVDVAFPAKVIDKEDKTVTINRGDGTGIKAGETWDVFGPARTITDPDTGAVIKRKGKLIGRVKITSVDPDSAQGELIEDNGVAVGAILNRPVEATAAEKIK